MTDLNLSKNFGWSTLASPITDVATSLDVASDGGGNFDTIASGEHIYLAIIDLNETSLFDNFEIVKATLRTNDQFNPIVRSQEGTTAKAFPITSGNPVANVRVIAATTIEQIKQLIGAAMTLYERVDTPPVQSAGNAVLYPLSSHERLTKLAGSAGSTSLFVLDDNTIVSRPNDGFEVLADQNHDWSAVATPEIPRIVAITPTAERTITLPKLRMPLGWTITIINLAAAQNIIIKSQDTTTIMTFLNGHVTLMANRNFPTAPAHWAIIDGGGGARPAFHTHRNGTDQLNITGTDQIEFNLKAAGNAFDTNGNYDTNTFRFLPTVPGIYFLYTQIKWFGVTAGDTLFLQIHKDGAAIAEHSVQTAYVSFPQAVSINIESDGTNYFEVFAADGNRDTADVDGDADVSYFNGSLQSYL